MKPFLTTGIALASAGAIVAATPGLMAPPNIAIAASDSASVASKRSVAVDQLNLLALSDIDIQTISDIFFRADGWGGYLGGTYDAYYSDVYGQHELYVEVPQVDEDGNPVVDEDGNPVVDEVRARNANGAPLNVYLDENGDPILVVNGEDGPQLVPVYVVDENGDLVRVNEEDATPAYWTYSISGNIRRDGLVGLAYYLGDQVLDEVIQANLPLISDAAAFAYNNVTSYLYEGGLEETFRVVASELTGGPNGLVGQVLATAEDWSHNWLTYTGAILTAAAAGVPLAGPDLSAATSIFFFGGAVVAGGTSYNQGIDGVISYVIDRVLGAPAPGAETEEETDATVLVAGEEGADGAGAESRTALLASAPKVLDKLIDIDLEAEEDVQTGAVDETVEGGTATVTPVVEVSQPEAPEFELPKLPKLDLGLDLTPESTPEELEEVEEEEAAAEEKAGEPEADAEADAEATDATDTDDTGAANGAPNKFEPKSFGRSKSKETNGSKFLKNLDQAVKKFTGADAEGDAKDSTDAGDQDKKDNKDK